VRIYSEQNSNYLSLGENQGRFDRRKFGRRQFKTPKNTSGHNVPLSEEKSLEMARRGQKRPFPWRVQQVFIRKTRIMVYFLKTLGAE